MRVDRVGFLICRLLAVALVVWNLPQLCRGLVELSLASDGRYLAEGWLNLTPYVAFLCAAGIIWQLAGFVSRMLGPDPAPENEVGIDAAQFATIGLALLGVLALVTSVGGVVRVVTNALDPAFGRMSFIHLLFDRGNSDAPTMAVVGLLILAFAPRLGIWLEQASLPKEERADEPA